MYYTQSKWFFSFHEFLSWTDFSSKQAIFPHLFSSGNVKINKQSQSTKPETKSESRIIYNNNKNTQAKIQIHDTFCLSQHVNQIYKQLLKEMCKARESKMFQL